MEKGKRNRLFSATEINKLLELIEKYPSLISNKEFILNKIVIKIKFELCILLTFLFYENMITAYILQVKC